MKNKFACFYDVKNDDDMKKIWKDESTLFIFDTNVLLSLYAFKADSRKDFFKVLSKIEKRIWIPFHVCLEFQLNRITVIKNRRNSFGKLKKEITGLKEIISLDEKYFSTLQSEFSLKKKHPDVFQKLKKVQSELVIKFKEIESYLKSSISELQIEVEKIDNEKLFINSDDFIRKDIDSYFNDERIGDNLFTDQESIDTFNKIGEERYRNLVPPGYEDAKDKGDDDFLFDKLRYKRKFGDLIIFKQMIEHAKKHTLKNIVFISEDVKEDWRQIEDFDGKKILGARHELKREMYNDANVSNFLIFNIEEFMSNTNKYLEIEIQKDTINNIKESLAKFAENFEIERQEKTKSDLQTERKMIEDSLTDTSIWIDGVDGKKISFDKIKDIYMNDCKNEIHKKSKVIDSELYNTCYDKENNELCNDRKNYIYMIKKNKIYKSKEKDHDYIYSQPKFDNIIAEALFYLGQLDSIIHLSTIDEKEYNLKIRKKRLFNALSDYRANDNHINYLILENECMVTKEIISSMKQ